MNMICVLIIYTPTSKPNNVCLILTHLFKETKVGKLNFTSVCRLYIPPSSLLPPPSSLLPPPSSSLLPPSSSLIPPPSSLLTPHSSLLTPHSSLLLEAIARKTHLSPASCDCCLLHATATVAANDDDHDLESSRALRVGAKDADNRHDDIGGTCSSSTQDDADCRDCFG
jgi:hypothetical protein